MNNMNLVQATKPIEGKDFQYIPQVPATEEMIRVLLFLMDRLPNKEFLYNPKQVSAFVEKVVEDGLELRLEVPIAKDSVSGNIIADENGVFKILEDVPIKLGFKRIPRPQEELEINPNIVAGEKVQ